VDRDINWDGQMLSIRGPKGVGKTTMMLQYGYYPYYIKNKIDYYTAIEQVTFWIIDDEMPIGNKLPLWTIGFLY
jgi:predicted AAA+ superfamily ATPase